MGGGRAQCAPSTVHSSAIRGGSAAAEIDAAADRGAGDACSGARSAFRWLEDQPAERTVTGVAYRRVGRDDWQSVRLPVKL